MTYIHSSAVVDKRAELAADVIVGPGVVIGPHVRVGNRTEIGPYAVLDGHLTLGQDNRIFAHSVLGTGPQDYKYKDEPTRLELGDRNIIREFVTIHRGTPQGNGVTRIKSDVFLMAYSHVAHDNTLEDHVVWPMEYKSEVMFRWAPMRSWEDARLCISLFVSVSMHL